MAAAAAALVVVVLMLVVAAAAAAVVVAMAADVCVSQVSTAYELLFQAQRSDMRLCKVTLQPEEVSYRGLTLLD